MLFRPSAAEHAELLAQLAPLPLRGRAWPSWVATIAWVVLLLIAVYALQVLGRHQLPPAVLASLAVCIAALALLAWWMSVSVTEISAWGIRQSWLLRRELSWEDLQHSKFIPLFASKKLVCFVARGRPVVFQAGTRELQAAFARISLVYRRRGAH